MSLQTVYSNCASKEGHEQMNIFLNYNAALVTVHMYYHCQQHKFLKHCCSTCAIVHSDVQLNHTHTHTHSKCGIATGTVVTPTYRNARQYVYKQHRLCPCQNSAHDTNNSIVSETSDRIVAWTWNYIMHNVQICLGNSYIIISIIHVESLGHLLLMDMMVPLCP